MAVTAFLVLANLVLLGMVLRGRAATRRAARVEAAAAIVRSLESVPSHAEVRVLPTPHRPVAEVAVVPTEVVDLASYRLRRSLRTLERAAR